MYIEDIDKIVTEVARRDMKEFLEDLMNTERDVFLMENHGQIKGYLLDKGQLFARDRKSVV